jgi:hypothetical protein
LKIVRSYKQYLYEEDGSAYLDCINNVAHGEKSFLLCPLLKLRVRKRACYVHTGCCTLYGIFLFLRKNFYCVSRSFFQRSVMAQVIRVVA